MEWINRKIRVPEDRRLVHCWGYATLGSYTYKDMYLGTSRCNVNSTGDKFDMDSSSYLRSTSVTHWAEIIGPKDETIRKS